MLLFNKYAESIESKTPNACLGKVLSKAVEEKVVAFYLSNNVSRKERLCVDVCRREERTCPEKVFTVQPKGCPFAVFR